MDRNDSTYLLVDGENIDATLGNAILSRRPHPDERPRWDRIRDFAETTWSQPVKPLFFLNGSSGELPMPFVQALLALRYRPIPLSGAPGEKVVDIGIKRTMDALANRRGDVLLASHDGDFLAELTGLMAEERRVGVIGFKELLNAGFAELAARGLAIFDLEDDVGCFDVVLPRVRIIPISNFDPLHYL